jgi:ribonuclease P protein component
VKTARANAEILRGYKSFSRIISEGKQVSVSGMKTFFVAERSTTPVFQAGFAVTKRLRRAVDRNRAKRMMREAERGIRVKILQVVEEKQVSVRAVFMFLGVSERRIRKIPAHDFGVWMDETARLMTAQLARNTR